MCKRNIFFPFQFQFKLLATWTAVVLLIKRNNKNSRESVPAPNPIDAKVENFLVNLKEFWLKSTAKDTKWSTAKNTWNKIKCLRIKINYYIIQSFQHLMLTSVGFNNIFQFLFYSELRPSVTKMIVKCFTLFFPPLDSNFFLPAFVMALSIIQPF